MHTRYMTSSTMIATLIAAAVVPAAAQQTQAASRSSNAAASAMHIVAVPAAGELRLDGRLDEAVWQTAVAATGFTQREPVEGVSASQATVVRFAFDADALWIAARMTSEDPSSIRGLVTRRDREGSSEQLTVSLDTYGDGFTAYTFGVTPAGVRIDYYHPADNEAARDYGYDPVWDVATAVDADGWTAELRIPFSQLRFSDDGGAWGVNIVRRIPATNEVSYWVLVGRDEAGWSSRMGELTGLEQVRPGLGIELLPYVAAASEIVEVSDVANPFLRHRSASATVGGDMRMGIGPNLTLSATVNPDFGQVEADPAEVNLSAFETFFEERRPFFSESAQLFGGRGLFYSRRIGAVPPVSPDADYFERLDNTTILGAAKLAGRMPSGLSIGALAAVTAQEEVSTYNADGDVFGTAVVAPRTVYGVASARQEFGADASTVSALVTGVRRDLDPASPVAALVPEDAVSALIDTRIRWAGGKYDMSAYAAVTHVRGGAAAITNLQRSSRRYWQRPDAPHVEVDPLATSMSGTHLGINHSKMAGAHWLWDIDYYQRSPGFEPNDIGALGRTDDRGLSTNLVYRETEPGRLLRSWLTGLAHRTEWTFAGERQFTSVLPYVNFTLPNFWRVNLDAELFEGGLNDVLTRGGPLMDAPDIRALAIELQNNPGSRTRWGVQLAARDDNAGGSQVRIEPGISFRPGVRWELSLDPRWQRWTDSRQFILSRADGPATTFGRRYVFSHVDRSEVAMRVRLNYTFTPALSLESYIEPFAASGSFHSFGELPAARSGELLMYGDGGTSITTQPDGSRVVVVPGDSFTIGPRDFNVRSLRSNLVLRWEWRAGSTAYVVWQQDGFAEHDPARVAALDAFDALDMRADHYLAIKVSYWLPMR